MSPLKMALKNVPVLISGALLGGLLLFWLGWLSDLVHEHKIKIIIEPTEVHECTQSNSTS